MPKKIISISDKKPKIKSINVAKKRKKWYIKTILSYYFVDNQNYKVGNQCIDGSIGSIDGWIDG